MNRTIIITVTLAALMSMPLMAQSLREGRVLGESVLYKEPFSDAKIVSTLQPDSVVTVVKRKGGWYQIKTSRSVSGWLRMSTLRFGEQKTDKQAGNLSGLKQTISLFKTGRSGTSGVTVATGIRGLDAADLQNSKPDRQALGYLSNFTASQRELQNFALAAKLKSRELAFIVVEESK